MELYFFEISLVAEPRKKGFELIHFYFNSLYNKSYLFKIEELFIIKLKIEENLLISFANFLLLLFINTHKL